MSDIAYKVIVNNNGIDDIIFKTIMIKGNDGSSIASIEKTSTAGNVDTYTIYLTDGTIGGTFTVTNSDASSLNSLTDVTIASATAGQALIYDATAGKWKNGDIAQSIDNLTDVDISSLAEGDMLIYDATTGKWTNGQTPDELSELDDVDITDAQTGESLIFDGVNQKWVNGNPSQSLAGLDDVDVASAQNGDVLKYNATTGKWEDGAITVSESLDDLSDVEIDSATAGQALVYDQTTGKWVNGAVSSVGALDDLTDVNISNAQDNQELVYDDASSEWQNKSTRIECTQAEYDALVLAGTVLPNVDYYITDAGGGEIVSANPNISDAYDSTHNYVAGDLCIHDDVLYKANASTTGTWDASKWTHTTVDDVITALTTVQSITIEILIACRGYIRCNRMGKLVFVDININTDNNSTAIGTYIAQGFPIPIESFYPRLSARDSNGSYIQILNFDKTNGTIKPADTIMAGNTWWGCQFMYITSD